MPSPAPDPPRIADLVAPRRHVARYAPQCDFPPYRYVPGVHPHPVRDARGHSYKPVSCVNRHPDWDSREWPNLKDWLRGVDLFNAFYFWEAHEAWEELWAVKPRECREALMLQGLIQIAAALLKTHMRSLGGAARLSREGLEKIAGVAEISPYLMGLDAGRVHGEFVHYFRPLEERMLPPLDASVPILVLADAQK